MQGSLSSTFNIEAMDKPNPFLLAPYKILQNKLYLLIALALISLLLSYIFAFKLTFEAFQLNQRYKGEILKTSNTEFLPSYEIRKSKNLDKLLNRYTLDSSFFRNKILSSISYLASESGVKLTEVPTLDPKFNTEYFMVQRLDFEGDYFSLIKFLNQLETSPKLGMPRSLLLYLPKQNAGSQNLPSQNLPSQNASTQNLPTITSKTYINKAPTLILRVYLEIGK